MHYTFSEQNTIEPTKKFNIIFDTINRILTTLQKKDQTRSIKIDRKADIFSNNQTIVHIIHSRFDPEVIVGRSQYVQK